MYDYDRLSYFTGMTNSRYGSEYGRRPVNKTNNKTMTTEMNDTYVVNSGATSTIRSHNRRSNIHRRENVNVNKNKNSNHNISDFDENHDQKPSEIGLDESQLVEEIESMLSISANTIASEDVEENGL